MSITTLSSRELNQDVGKAKKAARNGPVLITDRGRPAHVLLTIEDYRQLTSNQVNIVEQLAMPELPDIDIEFDPPRLTGQLFQTVDF
ncbi:MAG: type II toxin-antitoxin system Phd/YefM family antitoxin [Methylococcaceae bacterium]|nr:type II toxin-antitoxin system Phd/YefM family antitoxin [Methylococcales bacterium]NOS87905.1 type II toxin-antitoxin system Phd/YefM family antitoxin [Methylococcaceae bacterium]